MFTVKSKEELAEMSSEEVVKYWHDKLAHEKAELEARVKTLEDSKNDEALKSLGEEIQKLKDEQLETLKSALKEQGRVIKKLKDDNSYAEKLQSVEEGVKSAWIANLDQIKLHKTDRSKNAINFAVKVAGDMTLAGNVSGGTMPQPLRLDGVNDIAERKVFTYDLCSKLTTDKNSVEWVYESAQDGTIDGTAEGAAKDQIDNDFVVASISFKKRAAYFKVSTEMLDDVTFMGQWLRNKLFIRLFIDVDNEVLNGTGAGQSLNGIISLSTAFSASAPFANGVDNANEIDVLVAAINQIEVANQNIGGLTIQMHPTDVNFLKTMKVSATDKRYVERVTLAAGQLSVDGVPVVKNNNVTQGDYIVGDFSKAIVAQKGSIMLELGLDGNDFTKNMRTLLAEWRGEVIIENNDRTAFVTGDFATDKAALETA